MIALGIIYEDAILEPVRIKKKRQARSGKRSLKRAKDRLVRIFSEYGGVFCFYCKQRMEEDEITGDHLIPISKKGVSNCSNVVLCCYDCNTKKGDSIVELDDVQQALIDWQKTLVGRSFTYSKPPFGLASN